MPKLEGNYSFLVPSGESVKDDHPVEAGGLPILDLEDCDLEHEGLKQIAELVARFDYLQNPNDRHPVIREIDKVLVRLKYRS